MFPKQFLKLAGERTLLQQAADRCRPWIADNCLHVVTNAAHAATTHEQLPQVPVENILLEPCGRNTAPCIGLAALHVHRQDPEAVLLVTPADHLIRPDAEFRKTVERALALVEKHPRASVLMGIPPTYPATGYGYIERGESAGGGAYAVQSFREKPTRDVAREFLDAGRYDWNAGIFVWRASGILDLLREFQPQICERLTRLEPALSSSEWNKKLADEFPGMPSISIDYGVLEPAAARHSGDAPVFVVPASFDWDDVGSWQSLPRVLGSDDSKNTVTGAHVPLDTERCVIRTSADHLVATIGVKDLVIVHTPDATLIAPRDDEDALRKVVALIQKSGYERFL